MKGRITEHLMVRHYGNMTSDTAYRIAHGSSILDLQPLYSVGIIAGPALRRIIKQARIKPSSPTCAGFKENLWKFLRQTVVKIIHPKDITVEYLSLPVRRKRGAVTFRNTAVHIPFNIRDPGFGKDFFHHCVNTVHNLFSGKIKDILISSMRCIPSRRLQNPVRMLPVQIGILVYHLRLKPEAEFHSKSFYLFREPPDPFRQTLPICIPVSKSCMLSVSFPEPSVVQHKKLHAALPGFFRNLQELFFRKVEVSSFPVINKDRSGTVSPESPCQSPSIKAVKSLAHAVQPLFGINYDCLGSLKLFSRFQLPVKSVRMDPRRHACDVMGIHFRLYPEVPAVDQADADHLPGSLCSVRTFQRYKRILFMRRVSPPAVHSGDSLLQNPFFHVAFSGPRAGKLHPYVIFIRKIKIQTHGGKQVQILRSFIAQAGASGNRRLTVKNSIQEFQPTACKPVF